MTENTEVLIGLGLFVASELVGMSKLKSNSLLELVLRTASVAFPYELKRRETPTRERTPATTTKRRTRA